MLTFVFTMCFFFKLAIRLDNCRNARDIDGLTINIYRENFILLFKKKSSGSVRNIMVKM